MGNKINNNFIKSSEKPNLKYKSRYFDKLNK